MFQCFFGKTGYFTSRTLSHKIPFVSLTQVLHVISEKHWQLSGIWTVSQSAHQNTLKEKKKLDVYSRKYSYSFGNILSEFPTELLIWKKSFNYMYESSQLIKILQWEF